MVLAVHIQLHVTGEDFLEKYDVKKDQKTMFFGLLKKIKSLALSGIGVKRKFLWSFDILQKLHAWEKSTSQVMDKNGSRTMRFQYSLILNISLID